VKENPEAKEQDSQTSSETPRINRLENLRQQVQNPQDQSLRLLVQAIKETPGLWCAFRCHAVAIEASGTTFEAARAGNLAFHATVGLQPRGEGRVDFDEPALSGFGFRARNLDLAGYGDREPHFAVGFA